MEHLPADHLGAAPLSLPELASSRQGPTEQRARCVEIAGSAQGSEAGEW